MGNPNLLTLRPEDFQEVGHPLFPVVKHILLRSTNELPEWCDGVLASKPSETTGSVEAFDE